MGVANFVILMVPCRALPSQDQELVFGIMEHVCLFVHLVIYALFPHHSIKSDRIEETHRKFLLQHHAVRRYNPHTPEKLQDISNFDVGIYHKDCTSKGTAGEGVLTTCLHCIDVALRRRNKAQDVVEESDEEYE